MIKFGECVEILDRSLVLCLVAIFFSRKIFQSKFIASVDVKSFNLFSYELVSGLSINETNETNPYEIQRSYGFVFCWG